MTGLVLSNLSQFGSYQTGSLLVFEKPDTIYSVAITVSDPQIASYCIEVLCEPEAA